MADNQSNGIQHLTSLDLDIRGITQSLEDAKRQIEEFSQEIGVSLKENVGNKFSEAFNLSNLNVISSGTGTGGLLDKFEINLEEKFGFGSIEDKFQEMREQIAGSVTELERINAIYDKNQNIIGVSVDYVTQEKDRYHELYEMVNVAAEGEEKRYELKLKSTRVIDDEVKKERERIKEQEKAQREQEKINNEIDRTVQKFERMGVTAKNSGYGEIAEQANTAALSLRDIKKLVNDGSISFENATQQVKAFNAQYAELSTKILDEKGFQNLLQQTKALESQFIELSQQSTIQGFDELSNEALQFSNILKELTKYLQENGTATEKDVNTIKDFSDLLDELRKKFGEQKVFASQAKEIEALSKQLNTLSNRFEVLAGKAEKSGNKELSQQAQQASSSIQRLIEKLKNQSISFDEAKVQLNSYSEQLPKLQREYANTSAAHESFMKAIIDKARWYAAFQVQYQLINIFKEIPAVIKKTEDAVVELRRVLSDDIPNNIISQELYDIGYEYGRTFEDVSEVATKFAQAGYNWNDTIELTRGTMLALNTAELDVTQSTQGLIAILQQWNLEADEYASVIDKINVTADHFAVTSETIVAALQRASSSARNANISLEDTIGIITTLAESTGRSGENIGTALNSLIVYTQKAKSLEVFASLGGKVKDVVNDFKSGAASILDVWQALSVEMNNLNEQQQVSLLKMTDYESFADELENEASEFTDKIRSTYETAGSYRQNYFIALLNNMEKLQEVSSNMANYQGYSIKENENYMESLSAMWNQLKSMLAQLAVQVGEGDTGLLNLLKTLTNVAIVATKAVKNMGGLVPLLTAIAGIILQIQRVKIAEHMGSVLSVIPNFIGKLRSLAIAFNEVYEAEGLVAAMNATLGGGWGWIGLAVSAVSGLTMAYNAVKSSIEEAKRASVESADSHLDEAKSLESLKEQYLEIAKSRESEEEKLKKLDSLKQDIIKAHYSEKDAIDKLNLSTKNGIALFDELYKKEVQSAYVQISDQYDEAAQAIEHAGDSISIYTNKFAEQKAILEDFFSSVNYDELGNVTLDFGTENLQEQIDILNQILSTKELDEEIEQSLRNILEDKNEILQKHSDIYSKYTETVALNRLYQKDIQETISKINAEDNAEQRRAMFDDLIEYVEELNLGYAVTENMLDVLYALFGYVREGSEEAKDSMDGFTQSIVTSAEELAQSIKDLNSEIDSIQSGLDVVNSAIEEYNSNGVLSLDTVQKLISAGSEYVQMLEFTESGIKLNESATNALISAQTDNVKQLLATSEAEGVLDLANKYLISSNYDLAVAEGNAAEGSDVLKGHLATLIEQAYNGIITFDGLSESILQAFNVSSKGKSNVDAFIKDLRDLHNVYKNLGKSIGSVPSRVGGGGGSKSGSNAQKAALEEQKKALKERYETEKKILEKLKDQENENYKELKKQLEERKKLIKEYYNLEISKLKELEEQNDRIRKKEDYYRNRQQILDDIESLSSRSGVEYRQQEAESRQKLQELDRDWQRTLEDWNTEDKIKEIEKLRDAEIASIDAQMEELEKAHNQTISHIEDELDKLKEIYDSQISSLEKTIESISKAASSTASGINSAFSSIDPFSELPKKSENAMKKIAENFEGGFAYTTDAIKEMVFGSFNEIYKKDIGGMFHEQLKKSLYNPIFTYTKELQKRADIFSGTMKQTKNLVQTLRDSLQSMPTLTVTPKKTPTNWGNYNSQNIVSTSTINNKNNNVYANIFSNNTSSINRSGFFTYM